ncbi:MAG: glycosyltransferase family 39 protein [Candidatus Pseudobacter hemicellulosilyticus]|uniref:Glycosyltransferase family 39 protein n=1 Tax=Candidatus Pseudobacter hemicellulosilyticus TaxID=3121375 RepID=A0AAJ5WVF0_9BACT|nr:MAG: glycosyltransferase family 39 protein [Pseudobacter sp.]
MLPSLKNNHRLYFYLIWFTVNFLQACFTDLIDDEAYYWVYSQFPAWGYFDHPPMIAWLIKAGYALFHHEIGVRFFIVLLNTATVYLIQQLTEKKDDLLFYTIATSVAVAHLGGILAVPDLPLIFFVALFFCLYRRFTRQMTIANSLLLGLGCALMLYSKYHGVLIIGFTLLSNLTLFKKYQTYIAGGFALLLFAPHLYWQYQHDFPSVQYHLFERNASSYQVAYTMEYLIGQIALAGPLMGWLFLWAVGRYKPANLTEKALKFSLVGFYAFFLVSTLKGRVEANWTIPVFVALIALSHQYIVSDPDPSTRKWLCKSLPLTMVLILLVRVYMLSFMPGVPGFSKDDEIHGSRNWVSAIREKADGAPVVFTNSYQRASKYWFYAGQPALSMNGDDYRRNNYNFWPIEDSLIGKRVLAVCGYRLPVFEELLPGTDSLASCWVGQYFSFSKVQIRLDSKPRWEAGSISFGGEVLSPAHYLDHFRQSPYDTAALYVTIVQPDEIDRHFPTGFTVKQLRQERQPLQLQVPVDLPAGHYTVRLALSTAIPQRYSLNSTSFALEVPAAR